ncbi:Sec-independent protein translocase subunit TatA/TatB [Polaribacter sp. SA4-12]|uniref:Sec-independent protein translocase subunit TatA/TatB n=1 Tax=Polaribacter sp. SA4-12 TaxID=1312072 RepID=UPI000B3C3466|nr:twin-arginine translocase TatA/TatE family subunit [Polaribacter sp. SA4-12]ARV15733.1 Sec-independent protein translocase TatA [Polaribacter sp. SA4-12]
MNSILLFISGPEIMVIMLIVVMVFGADKIPEIARGLGKGIRQVKDATNDIKKEIKDSSEKNGIDTDITKDLNKGISEDFKRVKKEMSKVKDNIDDLTGPIKRNF